ncbi:MAG: ABC transporter permease subunit [Anaerolineales bacterium]
MSLFVAFRKEWMELIRSYRLMVVVIVLLFFGLTSPLLAKFTPELLKLIPTGGISIQMPPPTLMDAVGQYIKNMAQFGILLALLLTMGAIAQEKDKGTAAMMLVKPLPRGAFLAAKFLGLAAMFAVSLAVAGIAAYYYTLLLFEAMDIVHWLVLNALLFVYVLVFVAITLCCSTLTKSQAAAGGIALGLLIFLGLIGSIPGLGKYLPGELTTWGTRLMSGDTTPSWAALGISLGLIVVPLLAAWIIFRNQEI